MSLYRQTYRQTDIILSLVYSEVMVAAVAVVVVVVVVQQTPGHLVRDLSNTDPYNELVG